MREIYTQQDQTRLRISKHFSKSAIKWILISIELKLFWAMKQAGEIQRLVKIMQILNIRIQIIIECMAFIMARFLQFLTKVMPAIKEEIIPVGACNNSTINWSEKGNKSCRNKREEEAVPAFWQLPQALKKITKTKWNHSSKTKMAVISLRAASLTLACSNKISATYTILTNVFRGKWCKIKWNKEKMNSNRDTELITNNLVRSRTIDSSWSKKESMQIRGPISFKKNANFIKKFKRDSICLCNLWKLKRLKVDKTV